MSARENLETIRDHERAQRRERVERRRDLCAERVTLNGRPARITGALEPFAHVRELEGPGHVEYAWSTAAGIVRRGGDFRA